MIKTVLIVGVCLLAAVVAFFVWANRATARAHARFQAKDVESALSELFAPDSPTLDNFDLFLAWPIDDPYLESVRQRCLHLVQETDTVPSGQAFGDAALQGIAALLNEVRHRDGALSNS